MLAIGLALAGFVPTAVGAEPQAGERYAVAILNFETGSKEISSFGEIVPDLLAVNLAGNQSLQLVERAGIKKLLEEMGLGKTGLVDEQTSARIGKLTGAKFLVTGRAFIVGDQIYITAKIIGTETGMVGAQLAKGPMDGDIGDVVQDLATKVSAYMAERGQQMLPKEQEEVDVVAELRRKFEGKPLPKFTVAVSESHLNRPIADPAVQTEITFLLRSLGATVVSSDKAASRQTEKPDILISGDAFSEYAGTTNNLISVKGRVELKATDVKSGKVLAVGRDTVTAVDLAENIAAKSALQKAASRICLTFLPEAVAAREAGQ
jgi:TolB-like protein